MQEIVTITFNPAIDKSATVPVLIPERKLRCTTPVYEPGGGGTNVARAVKKLGGDVTAVFLAGGCTGKMFNKLLAEEFIRSVMIEIQDSTRENLTVFEKSSAKQYRFAMPAPEITGGEWANCLTRIENLSGFRYLVASGSLPPNIPPDLFSRLAWLAKREKARLIIDTSGDALKQAANQGAYLLKPNLKELASMVGEDELKPQMVAEAGKTIIGKGTCEVLIISMGPLGARLITKDLDLQIVAPPVKILSTVGAGDSMVAGIVLSLSRKRNLVEAVQFGVACGTAATMNPGTELCRLKDANRLYNLIRHGE